MSIRTKRNSRRFIAAAAAVAVAASTFIATSSPLSAAPVVTENTRIAGADRYATANAVAVAKVGTNGNANRVVLVSGENFPDGLAAASLAGALGAPMLLTQAASLPTSVLATLTIITAAIPVGTAKNVIIVGGTSAVSAGVAAQLTASGFSVTRIAGADRYATANAVAAATRSNAIAIGTFGASNLRTAFLASGTNFPDALAASAMAYAGSHPIFLTNGTSLTDETKAAMIAAGVQQVLILGGTSAVSAEVATAVAGVTGVVASSRIGGANRYETATALATAAGAADASFKSRAYLVSGTDFPDALVAAQLAGGTNSGAIIPVTSPLPAAISTWVTANQATLTEIQAIGGTSVVPAEIVTAVKTGATTDPLSATITAVDGDASFKVAFSAGVTKATAENIANYRVTSAIGTSKTISTGTYVLVGSTVTIPVSLGLAAGDTVQILPNSVFSSVTAELAVAAASLTVVANTAVPTLTIVAYPTTVAAAAVTAQRAWITFDSNASVLTTPGAVVTELNTNLKYAAPTIGSAATAIFTGCAQVGATRTFTCDVDASYSMVAGGVVSLAANLIESTASVAQGAVSIKNAATSGTVTTDVTSPSISSATFTQSGTADGAVQATVVVGGEVTISARAGSTVGGKAGNKVAVHTVTNAQLPVVPTCTYTAATNTVTISAAASTSALVMANACNTTTSFNALFTANATTADGLTDFAPAVTLFTGGLDLVTVTLAMSEPMKDFDGTNDALTISGVLGGTATAVSLAPAPAPTADAQRLAGVFIVLATTNGTIVPSVSTVALVSSVGDVADRAGNTGATTPVQVALTTPAS